MFRFEGGQQIGVKTAALIHHPRRFHALLVALDFPLGFGQFFGCAVDAALVGHRLAQFHQNLLGQLPLIAKQFVYPLAIRLGWVSRHRLLLRPTQDIFGNGITRPTAEHGSLQQAVRAKPVGSMHTDTSALSRRKKALHPIPSRVGQHTAVHIRGNAAHAVVRRRLDGNQIGDGIGAHKINRNLAHLGQFGQNALCPKVAQIQIDALLVGHHSPPLVNLRLLRTADQIAGGEFHFVGRVILHKTLPRVVQQIAPFAPARLAHQNTVPI